MEWPRPRSVVIGQASGGPASLLRALEPLCTLSRSSDAAHARDAHGVIVIDSAEVSAIRVLAPRAAVIAADDLCDSEARARFLALLFALARLDEVEHAREPARLTGFHARYKYLLLAHDERAMRELGRTAADARPADWSTALERYRSMMVLALSRPTTSGGQANALMHAFGHVSCELSAGERVAFIDAVDAMQAGEVEYAEVLRTLRMFAARAGSGWLRGQALLEPWPPQLD